MSLPVLTAVTGAPWEAALVASLERGTSGVAVVRRCVDIAELLAAAATGEARAVLLSADLRRLDRDALTRLHHVGVGVVGVVAAGDEDAERRLRQIGVRHVLGSDADLQDLTAAVRAAVADVPGRASRVGYGDPRADIDEAADSFAQDYARLSAAREIDEVEESPHGTLVAVWGPTGAPGRTTVAVALASEAAELGRQALLADVDTYGGVVSQVLGLLDEAPGLAAAARAANNGQLDLPALARHARQVGPHLRVLTGIARADRWPELRPDSLAVVWDLCRSLVELTVADCGFSLEQDEELAFDTIAPRRNGATLLTVQEADVVVAVGSGDPVGMQRLVRGLGDLREVVPDAQIRVVVNRLRRASIGKEAEQQVREALQRYAGVEEVRVLPYDLTACDRAVGAGRTLAEVSPDSALRKALAGLTRELLGVPEPLRRGLRRASA